MLSVIELRPLSTGSLGMELSVCSLEEIDLAAPCAGLICLFEEPAEPACRMWVGAARLNQTSPPELAHPPLSQGVWLGSLPRLTRAGAALSALDVSTLAVPLSEHEMGSQSDFWFEVHPASGRWARVDADKIRLTLDESGRDARSKPFFVRAHGTSEQVEGWLCALRDQANEDCAT